MSFEEFFERAGVLTRGLSMATSPYLVLFVFILLDTNWLGSDTLPFVKLLMICMLPGTIACMSTGVALVHLALFGIRKPPSKGK